MIITLQGNRTTIKAKLCSSRCGVLLVWDDPHSECSRCRDYRDEGGSG